MDELHSYLDIAELAGKFLKGEITREESILLDAWIANSDRNKALWEKLTRPEYLEQQLVSWEDQDPEAAWKELLPAIRSASSVAVPPIGSAFRERPAAIRRYVRYAVAAFVIILAGSTGYVAYRNLHKAAAPAQIPVAAIAPPLRIPPGSRTAQLVLSNGKVIGLGAVGTQKIHEADGTSVVKDRDVLKYVRADTKKYVGTGANPGEDTRYNMVMTPRGGEYQLVLSDGTKVWLDAASSIRYPVCFSGKDRRVVDIVGEAYLEVAKDAAHPFIVTTRQSTITVLGTSFNVKAYPDEPADKTSLVEGLVKVGAALAHSPGSSGDPGDVLLRPGTQVVVDCGRGMTVGTANLEEALAWKNGLFVFQSECLESITRKLSRWYNIDIVFNDNTLKNIRFTGRLKRYDDMTVLLNMISSTSRVTFARDGLRLIVGAR
jgi:ferric-dicitrate binding protein FerR (iron transport regulator)